MTHPDPHGTYIPAFDLVVCRVCRGLFVKLPPSNNCPRCGTTAGPDPPDDCDEPIIVAAGD